MHRNNHAESAIDVDSPSSILPGWAEKDSPSDYSQGFNTITQTVSLEAGDLLVAFTDGVTETPNRNSEEFGDQRVTELLVRNAERPLDRIAEEIIGSVGAWAGDVERHDDTTLLLARRV